MNASKRSLLFLLYPVADFLITLIFSFASCLFVVSHFFAYFNSEVFLISVIFSLCTSVIIVCIFCLLKIYRILTKNFSVLDYIRMAFVAFLTSILVLVFISIDPFNYIPCSWLPLFFVWLPTSIAISTVLPSSRLFFRIRNFIISFIRKKNSSRTLIIGAGDCAKIAIDECRLNRNLQNKVILLLDDDLSKINHYLSSLPIKGPISNAKHFIEKYKIDEVIIAISTLSKSRLSEILAYLEDSNVRIRRMPLLSEMGGPHDVKITEIKIEELLSRKPVSLDNSSAQKTFGEKCLMVTGAGGSIGSELVRQLFLMKPKRIILFDIYENSTYDIQQELLMKKRKDESINIDVVTLIGSTYNKERVEQIIKKYRPDYIFHAAAYKHVPLMEDSPVEAIRTNVIGTYNVASLADKYNVKKMILVSTDKAVRPTNVMGATKRFAEMIVQHFSTISKNTSYGAVRFGNVLGSNGSVIPLFKKQLENGGPLTITDKNIIRYFMTIPEAVSLVLQCGIFCKGGEIFILDMGKPIKILDLALKMIRQAGKVPYKDIEIIETGLRPGEKLYEELLLDIENQTKTSNERIYIEKCENHQGIINQIKTVSKAFGMENNEEIKKLLASIVTTYHQQ